MNRILALQNKFKKFPFGNLLFSKALAGYAPYFKTIKPRVIELRSGYLKVSMKKRRAVQNHIKTVHAIACCNLCEFAAGICMEATIPKHRRWIPKSMNVDYLAKASSDLTAVCDLSAVDWEQSDVICEVPVYDTNGVVVVRAYITMYISAKPAKK